MSNITFSSVYAEKYHRADPDRYPMFRYHPDPLSNGVFEETDTPVACCCCGKETPIYYCGTFHTDEEVGDNDEPQFCPECISNGKAAEKYDGEFHYACDGEETSDPSLTDILIHRTPNYITTSYSNWRVHCDDYCAYLKSVSYDDIVRLGLLDEINADGFWRKEADDPESLLKSIEAFSPPQGHLFQCVKCGKHLLYIDPIEYYE